MKCVTVVLNSIHDPVRDKNQSYIILNRFKVITDSHLDKAG